MAFEKPLFRGVVVENNQSALVGARSGIVDAVDAEYEGHGVEKDGCNATDLLFHWTQLDGSTWDPRSGGYLQHMRCVMCNAKMRVHGNQIDLLRSSRIKTCTDRNLWMGKSEEPDMASVRTDTYVYVWLCTRV